jgi:3' terminal RNA ribose 2'-O-methyltransferase Hen1
MLLNISTTHYPATDLGYLLHKHPDKFQTIELSVGKAHIFYPEKSDERTTISLMLDIDPIDMVRGSKNLMGDGFSLRQYVNDRPYVASSFMSVAIAKAFSTALNGKCKDKPELVEIVMPFEISIASLPSPKGGERLIRKFFEPLGYEVNLTRHPLDTKFDWGESRYYSLTLKGSKTTQEVLSHLYVLIPALDNDKHYFIDKSEIEKLLEKGGDWLREHPEREQIVQRYLLGLHALSRKAIQIMKEEEIDLENAEIEEQTELKVKRETLHDKRLQLVTEKIIASGATTVLDLGCGEGKLIKLLMKESQITQISGMDVSYQELLRAKDKLRYDEMAPKQKERIQLFQGSLMYRDKRFEGFEAAAVVEVIEHLELNRLKAFERVLFEFAHPKTIVLTTPNQEYNVMWEKLDAETMRHEDHRFEWNREEFKTWVEQISEKYNYTYSIFYIGDEAENVGSPSQGVVFTDKW